MLKIVVLDENKITDMSSLVASDAITDLTISENEIYLDNIGAKNYLTAFSNTGEDISSKIKWTSSNEAIAVCNDGVVTALGYGSCIITALYKNVTAVCNITVNNPMAPYVEMSKSTLSLNVGDSYMISATPLYDAGSNVTFISSDESVATCDGGLIRAKKNGKCVIVAVTDKGYTGFTIVNVGDTTPNRTHKEYLKFDFPHLEKELKYIDSETGELLSSAVVTTYTMENELLPDGRLVTHITLHCVKTYDREGKDGTTPVSITTGLYREMDVLCDKKQHKTSGISVGDSFKVKIDGFTVQTLTNGTQREFYMTFPTITEG